MIAGPGYRVPPGAAGTTVLNGLTYLDMVLARPASSTPEESVRRLAVGMEMEIPGDRQEHENRVAGLAPLLGIGAGLAPGH